MPRIATELEIAIVDLIVVHRTKAPDAVRILRELADEIEREFLKAEKKKAKV